MTAIRPDHESAGTPGLHYCPSIWPWTPAHTCLCRHYRQHTGLCLCACGHEWKGKR